MKTQALLLAIILNLALDGCQPKTANNQTPVMFANGVPSNGEVKWDGTYIGITAIVAGQTKEAIRANTCSEADLRWLLKQTNSFLAAHAILTSKYGQITKDGEWNGITIAWDERQATEAGHGRGASGPEQAQVEKMWLNYFASPVKLGDCLIVPAD